MAVIITDNRTVVDQADSTTGWGGSNSPQLYTTQPSPVESTGCLGMDVSNTTDELYFTLGTSANLTDTLVYVWVLPNGALDTTVAGGVQIVLGDGTNRNGYHTGGSDFASFRHNTGPVTWQCLVIDTGNLPTNSTSFAGTPASLSLSAITQIGSPAVITVAEPHWTLREVIHFPYDFRNVAGMTEINSDQVYLKLTGVNTAELYTDPSRTTPLDTTGYGTFINDTNGEIYGFRGTRIFFSLIWKPFVTTADHTVRVKFHWKEVVQ